MRWRDLEWFASLDGGFNAPLALYWWICLPDGRFHIIREWKESGVWAEDLAAGRAFRVAVNQDVVALDALLPDNAEVAIFPPVTGG